MAGIVKDWAAYFSLGLNLQGVSKLEKKTASVEANANLWWCGVVWCSVLWCR